MKEKVLVLGASLKPERDSYHAVRLLAEHGHDVIAVGLKEGMINNTPILKEIPKDISNVDTVSLYLGPQNQLPYYDAILKLKPKRVIFNPGTENEELMEKLWANGIESEYACTKTLVVTGQF